MYIDPTGHEFTLNKDKKWGPDEVAAPVLSGKVTHEEYQEYLGYVEKHGSREQVVNATLGAAGMYANAYGQKVAKMEAAGAAGVVAGAPVAIAGGGVAATGAVAGATEGFVGGLLDKVSAAELAVRTAVGAALGATIGWAAKRVGAFIAGEASPSAPGTGKTGTAPMKPAAGEPPPKAPDTEAMPGLDTGPFEVNPAPAVPKVGETRSTRIGKDVHALVATDRRAGTYGDFDLVNQPIPDATGAPVEVPHRVNLRTGEPQAGTYMQEAQPDAVSFKRSLIIDDKPMGRPLAKDRQEIIRAIRAYEKSQGVLPNRIAISRYNPETGEFVQTDLYTPSAFLPKAK